MEEIRQTNIAGLKRKAAEPDVEFETEFKSKNMKFMTNLNDMPDDILFYLFKYLSLTELFYTARQVSQRWKTVADHPSFWKRITIGPSEGAVYKIVEILRTQSNVVDNILIQNRADTDEILDGICALKLPITVLELKKCQGKPANYFIGAKSSISLLRSLPKLKMLILSETHMRSVRFFEIFGSPKFFARRCKKMKMLNEPDYYPMTYKGLLTFRQLAAYAKNEDVSGKLSLKNGKQYTIEKVKEILSSNRFDPNSIVRTLDDDVTKYNDPLIF